MDLRFILTFAAPWKGTLALCGVMMVVESGATLAVPWLGGRFAGEVLDGEMRQGSLLLATLLFLLAAQAVLRFSSSFMLGRTAERVLADLRARLYDHLQALPLAWHQQRQRGETLALLTHDVEHLSGYITGSLLSVLPLSLTVLGALIALLRIDFRLGLVVLVSIPVFYLLVKFVTRKVRPLARDWQQAYAALVGKADENLGMLPVIKTFAREPFESASYRRRIDEVVFLSERQRAVQTALGPATQFLAGAGMIVMLWLISDPALKRTTGETISFLLYAAMLARPVSDLANLYSQTQYARGALHRLGDVFTERPEAPQVGGSILGPVQGAVEFRDVCFAYPGRPATLDHVNVRIAAGETLALTGSNGAGKSTLVHLLMRLMEPSSGQILIDGVDIQDVTLHSLRSQIGIVPQHVLLFNGSVYDNIAYGAQDATPAAIEAAAQLAQAHAFITRLPRGYASLIGEQGIRLSGGQRQRIALARALLKNPPILILDEATAMFDPDGERSFIADCHETLTRRTVILITHRPASLALADRTLRLEAGRIIQVDGGPAGTSLTA